MGILCGGAANSEVPLVLLVNERDGSARKAGAVNKKFVLTKAV